MKKKSFSNWQEFRRLFGIELFCRGWKQAAIADALNVSKMSVSRWIKKYEKGGKKDLQSVPRPGAPARLSKAKKIQIQELLYPGAEAWGFIGDVWTNARIANIIERQFGVRYHSHHVAKIMKDLGWTSHKPDPKASQRDEKQIQNWIHHKWPAIKKSSKREKDPISPR